MALLFLALALLLQTPAAPPRDGRVRSDPVAGKGVLLGRVLDAQSGQPLKNATVTVFSPRFGQEPPSTTTDGEGRWEISGLPSGEYHASATKGGFSAVPANSPRSIGLTESRPERSVDVRLVRGAVLSGRITDGDGEPVVGAQVMTLREIQTTQGRQWAVAGGGLNTDDRGAFRIWGLEAGEYLLAAQQEDSRGQQAHGKRTTPALTYFPGTTMLAEAQRFSLDAGAEYSDLTFSVQTVSSITVRGRMRTSGERFTNGFGMMLPADESPGAVIGMARSTAVAPDGSFVLNGVTSGSYRLSIRVELVNGDTEIGELDIVAADEDISGLEVVTRGPTLLTGRVVTQPAGVERPVMMVGAQPIGQRMDMGSYEQAPVKADGTFALKVFDSPVKLHLSLQSEGWFMSGVRWKGHDVRGGLMFEPGQPVEAVEIIARRAASHIAGVVTGVTRAGEDDNEGVVIVFRSETYGEPGIGIAGSVAIRDGRFTHGPMPAGDYQVVAVRTFDPSIFGKPDVAELLRARGTSVTLGENETKTVNLTLITDY